ncbi:MAG: CTP synthetase, CTP synthase [Candidatus Gottesmanbacteria bacterium GW2011_GWA2_43_14]|uniref:CTP synthase (glutamine hydrolyzing) n=1 Tax=Candidatus Gottesmanbacteria bacterium GW2011_GWA2_43_14 TaxID=1618443 RepID=A0A0G1FU11_9BACT|nr:MAG: CTP synthetase, CTP synthase [Candidatus Gottesmanbacteria bacterium GW2011_GWA2_43_14]
MPIKYVFISGGVLSGLGKGISSASIAFLLQASGYKVTNVKCENYLNLDAGTINPIEHGDPFLCEDGTEADMDIGTYEKFLDKNMFRHNFVTMGQIYKEVIDRERRFEYNGEDVEGIPHITNEIIDRINFATRKDKAEVVIVELGGTVGEYQNLFYYEASRILTLKNPGDVIHVHVSYLPTPPHLGEPKTKPTQQSVRSLNSMGIQPDFIIARSEKPLDKRRRDRFSLFCNIRSEDILSSPDAQTVYEVPLQFHEQNFLSKVCQKLGLEYREPKLDEWAELVKKIKSPKKKKITIAIVGKYFKTGEYQLRDSYAALMDAIDHAAWANEAQVKTLWIDAEKVEQQGESFIPEVDGLIVPIGWGERGSEGMIKAAGYARRKKIPYLGLCYGMQLAAVSFAREVLGWEKADTTENSPDTNYPVIHLMPAQKEIMARRAYGGSMRLGAWQAIVKKDTIAWQAYEKHQHFLDPAKGLTTERHRHRYEFNDRFVKDFEKAGLIVSARSVVENLVEIIELPKSMHPFYLGTQGHPEYKSRPLSPHPLFTEFMAACIR